MSNEIGPRWQYQESAPLNFCDYVTPSNEVSNQDLEEPFLKQIRELEGTCLRLADEIFRIKFKLSRIERGDSPSE